MIDKLKAAVDERPRAGQFTDDKRSAAAQWAELYDMELKRLQDMTRSGFLTPAGVRDIPGGVGIQIGDDRGTGEMDWSHPIGFALIDCDRHSHMVNGAKGATIRWNTKRSCVTVVEIP